MAPQRLAVEAKELISITPLREKPRFEEAFKFSHLLSLRLPWPGTCQAGEVGAAHPPGGPRQGIPASAVRWDCVALRGLHCIAAMPHSCRAPGRAGMRAWTCGHSASSTQSGRRMWCPGWPNMASRTFTWSSWQPTQSWRCTCVGGWRERGLARAGPWHESHGVGRPWHGPCPGVASACTARPMRRGVPRTWLRRNGVWAFTWARLQVVGGQSTGLVGKVGNTEPLPGIPPPAHRR